MAVAQRIETIHISQQDGFGRTLIDRQDYHLPALGYVVRYGALLGSLHDALTRCLSRFPDQISLLETTPAPRSAALQPRPSKMISGEH